MLRNGPNLSDSVVNVESGEYQIGNDSIPNAEPRHGRNVCEFWIDETPVSLGHVEVFVASGGYFENRWWQDSNQNGANLLKQGSVDQRCSEIRALSVKILSQLRPRPRSSSEVPAVGMTWMEAAAICRFFGGRLPFEAEWEVAMQTSLERGMRHNDPSSKRLSLWGCQLCLGFLEEWTAGAFTQRHWRDPVTPEFANADSRYGVCLRGSTRGSLVTDQAYRTSGDPTEGRPFRGFRRVWTEVPTMARVSSDFEIQRQ